jgi:hypothetical protein
MMLIGEKTKYSDQNPVPVLLCQPQIPHGLGWLCTRNGGTGIIRLKVGRRKDGI